jgi:hypothetical protein
VSLNNRKKIKKIRINTSTFAYQYLMYIKEITKSLPNIVVLTMVFTLFFILMSVFIFKWSLNSNLIKLILLIDNFSLLFGTLIKSINELKDKPVRVNSLLEINRDAFLNWVPTHIFISILAFNFTFFFIPLKITIIILTLMVSLSLTFTFGFFNLKQVLKNNEDIIVELLCDEDTGFSQYVKFVVSKMRAKKSDMLYINISTEETLTVNIALNWAKSRSHILGQEVVIDTDPGKIGIFLDLSKRDIKYSRFNILMDCICYIKSKSQIKGLEIECVN